MLKIGDKVRRINSPNTGLNPGDTGILTSIQNGDYTLKADKDGYQYTGSIDNLELIINKNNNNMPINLKEKFALALTKEPMKTFRKAGITNGDNLLTEEGITIFLSWLLDTKYAVEFKKDIVDGMLKDKKEEEVK